MRQKNIVDVNDYTRFQAGQNLKKKIVHVSADADHMRSIDEEAVARLEACEKREIDLLHFLRAQRGKARDTFPKKIFRVWLNAVKLSIAVRTRCLSQDQGGITASYLNDLRGLKCRIIQYARHGVKSFRAAHS